MALTWLIWFSNPISWMIAMMLLHFGIRLLRSTRRNSILDTRIVRTGTGGPEGVAAALMFLTTAYHPSVEFVAKAEIRESEDADDDEQGGPDTPRRHLHRQLRRIRHGERVDGLVLRLE
jgi:hypothetical protein